jgi:hypothetical protein
MKGAYYVVGRLPEEKVRRDLEGPFPNYSSAQHAVLPWVEKGYIDVRPIARVRERPNFPRDFRKR